MLLSRCPVGITSLNPNADPTAYRLEAEKEALVQERYRVFDEAMLRFNQHLGRIYRCRDCHTE